MNYVKFLGTAGARFVVSRQLRASGGIWLNLDDTNVLIDPGPGSLVRCLKSRPRLNPMGLHGIILTHRHLDHSNDINVMIEAMTNGGFKPGGVVFAPGDALEDDPVILKYVRSHVDDIQVLKEKGSYTLGNIKFTTPVRHQHGVETYGLELQSSTCNVSLIADTKYFKDLETYYHGDVVIINVVLVESKDHIMHLSLDDVERIITYIKPQVCVLTHFGMGVIKAKPWEIAREIADTTGVSVIAARDGMMINLDELVK